MERNLSKILPISREFKNLDAKEKDNSSLEKQNNSQVN